MGRDSFLEIFADALESGTVTLVPAELIVSEFQHILTYWDFDLLTPNPALCGPG